MASYIPTLCLAGFNEAAIHVGSDVFKLALGTGTVPAANRDSANEYFAGSDFTQATGAGYTTGGNTVTLAGAIHDGWRAPVCGRRLGGLVLVGGRDAFGRNLRVSLR